jgi:hypothetical protein
MVSSFSGALHLRLHILASGNNSLLSLKQAIINIRAVTFSHCEWTQNGTTMEPGDLYLSR